VDLYWIQRGEFLILGRPWVSLEGAFGLFSKSSHFSFLCAGGISGRDACTGKIQINPNSL